MVLQDVKIQNQILVLRSDFILKHDLNSSKI